MYAIEVLVAMLISWKDYLTRKFMKPPVGTVVGLAFTAEQVLCSVLRQKDGNVFWEVDASFSHHSWTKSLAEFVKQHKLQGAPCYFALTAHWYKMHNIDRPDVADAEVFNAIKWPLQELTSQSADLIYDYADLPANVGGQKKLLVVALARQEVEKLSRAIFDAELELASVSIEEFATVELTPLRQDAIITLVQEHGEEVVLNIVKNRTLYFSRRLKGFENIGTFSEAELDMGIIDSLCVQIQRSMDYFESQLRQAPVKELLLKLDTQFTDFASQKISSEMGIPCRSFTPNIECGDKLNFKMASFSCLGASYSHFVKQQSEIAEIAPKRHAEEQREVSH